MEPIYTDLEQSARCKKGLHIFYEYKQVVGFLEKKIYSTSWSGFPKCRIKYDSILENRACCSECKKHFRVDYNLTEIK